MQKKIIKRILWIIIVSYALFLGVHGIDRNSAVYNLIHIFSNTNNFLLLMYALAFVLAFYLYQKRKRQFDSGSLLYLIYVLGGIGGCWYYAQEKVDLYYPNISILPLLFLYVTINICLSPLWKADFSNLRNIDDRGMAGIYDFISKAFIVLSILPLLSLLTKFSLSNLTGSFLGNMYESAGDKSAMFFSGPSKMCFAVIRRFESLAIILAFYQLSKKNMKLVWGLCLTIMMFVLYKLLSGSRGGLVGTALVVLAFYLMLKLTMVSKIRSVVIKLGSIVGGLFAVCIALISISRFSTNFSKGSGYDTIDVWISQYLGESIPRFSDDVWNIGYTMDGYQNFMLLRKILGLQYIDNYEAFKSMYLAKLGTPVDVFYTYMGDIYLDFGTLGSIVFAVCFAVVFSRLLKFQESISIPKLMCLSVFFNMLGFGFAANVFRVIFIQEDTMWLLLLAVALSVIQVLQRDRFTPPISEGLDKLFLPVGHGCVQFKVCAL